MRRVVRGVKPRKGRFSKRNARIKDYALQASLSVSISQEPLCPSIKSLYSHLPRAEAFHFCSWSASYDLFYVYFSSFIRAFAAFLVRCYFSPRSLSRTLTTARCSQNLPLVALSSPLWPLPSPTSTLIPSRYFFPPISSQGRPTASLT